MQKIVSLQHPLIKHWIDLRKEKAYRESSGTVLLIGEKIIREYPFSIRRLVSLNAIDIEAQEKYLATEEMLKKITGLGFFAGVIAEVDLPSSQSMDGKKFLLILDKIQDPGNLGTLLRTSLALGWEGVVATPGTVDFFNDKSLRAGRGAIFRLPFAWKTPEEILVWAKKSEAQLWLADAKGKSFSEVSFQGPQALILSNEGQGGSLWAQLNAMPLAVPLKNDVESLNVSSAGAILLYGIKGIS